MCSVQLSPETVLVRRPELEVRINSSNVVYVEYDGARIECGSRGLAVLDAFYEPVSFSDALQSLQHLSDSAESWMNLTRTIVGLVKIGCLHEVGDTSPPELEASGFGALGIHLRMLNDKARTARFLKALEEIVEPGDVVVDIGTGTGVLAVGAARAGASRVYALEASLAAGLAKEVVRANGMDDRIEVIRGWSSDVQLPEKADVFVSEVIGDDPLAERVLEVVLDARKRLLKNDARLIPSRLRLIVSMALVPAEEFRRLTVSSDRIAEWSELYGIDFSPLLQARGEALEKNLVRPQKCREWVAAEAEVLSDIDLGSLNELQVDARVVLKTDRPVVVNAVIMQFDCALSDSIRLSTRVDEVEEDNHWFVPVWLMPRSIDLSAGEGLEVAYSYRVPKTDDGVRVKRVIA